MDGEAPGPARAVDVLLLLATVAAGSVGVVLLLLVAPVPRADRLWPVLLLALVMLGGGIELSRRRPTTRRIARRWRMPLVAWGSGFPAVAAVATWPINIGFLLFAYLCLLVVVDLVLLGRVVAKRRSDPLVALVGLVPIVLTWVLMLGDVPTEETARRMRVELAAPDLVADAQQALADLDGTDGALFVAADRAATRHLAGWVVLSPLLAISNGVGLVWDPDGLLKSGQDFGTVDGYPWFFDQDSCERIVDDWYECVLN